MRRTWLFAVAAVVGALAILPPMHDRAHDSFAWHMIQHLVLIFVVAPLIAYGLPRPLRFPGARLLLKPVFVVMLHLVVLWAWHLPVLYDLALKAPPLHALEHGSFVVTAVLLWVVIAGRADGSDHLRRAGAVFVTGLQSAALGALIAFASEPLYVSHLTTTQRFGWTPLEDQQLAGGLMWIPPGLVYLVITLVILFAWLNRSAESEGGLTSDAGSTA